DSIWAWQRPGVGQSPAAMGMVEDFFLALLPLSSMGGVEDGPPARRAVFENARISARFLDQLLERLEPGVFAHANEERIEAGDGNPFEVVDDFVAQVPGERAMRRMGTGNDQQRVAVRIAARHRLRGKAAGDARLWFYDDRLPQPLRHLVSQKPGDDVHVPSRREAMHELDGATRIILCRRAAKGHQCEERPDGYSGHWIFSIGSDQNPEFVPTSGARPPIAAAPRVANADPPALDRKAQGIRHEKVIIDATALGQLQRAVHATEHVVVDADLVQR